MIIQWSKNWIRECIACLSCGRIINQIFLFFNLCHVGKVNRFSKSHFAKKKFPVYITNFKRNRCTDLIKFWASCSIITGRAANITVLINTTHKKNLFENNSCPRLPVLFHLHRPLYATTLNHYYNLSELKVIRDAMLNS